MGGKEKDQRGGEKGGSDLALSDMKLQPKASRMKKRQKGLNSCLGAVYQEEDPHVCYREIETGPYAKKGIWLSKDTGNRR